MSVEGAEFHLDADNPEIIVESQQREGIEALAYEMQNIDYIAYFRQKEAAKDAMELTGDVERYQKYYDTDIEESFKTQSLEAEYDDKVDFARSIRLVAQKLGVDDQITMQYNIKNDTLNIDHKNLDNEFEL